MNALYENAVLRDAAPEDIPQISKLYSEYSTKTLDHERMTRVFSMYPAVVAEDDGLIGFCYCFRFAPDIIELANIYVSRDHRSSGVGGLLLEELIEKSKGKYSAIIAVNSTLNESFEQKIRPINFYKRHGFDVVFDNGATTVFILDMRTVEE